MTTTTTNALLDAALCYADLGYPVLPLRPGEKRPLTAHGLTDATTDHATIERWWSETPGANIGLLSNGLLVVDVDGADNPYLTPERELAFTGAPQALTPRGGRHVVFRAPPGTDFRNTTGRLASKVDTRANGGYIVAAPSVVEGRAYQWTEELGGRDQLPDLPDEILAALRLPPKATAAEAVPPASGPTDPTMLTRAAAYLEKMPPAVSGQSGHDATYRAAVALVHGFALSEAEALRLLAGEYNPRCRPPWTDDELRHKVHDAATKTHDKPHGWLRDAPTIILGTDEHRCTTEAVNALVRDPDLFARGTQLVRVVRAGEDRGGGLTIGTIPLANLRDRLTRCARFYVEGDETIVAAHPPDWIVKAVDARAGWPGLRELAGVAEAPFVRPDGSICAASGYDPATRILLQSAIDVGQIPDRPTLDDAVRARDELLEVVHDFKFEEPEDRAAWLGGLLTIPARPAFDGPAPLHLIDANVRGAGKGLAVQCIAEIALGRPLPVTTWPADAEELRKRITALALGGDVAVLLDNVADVLGNHVLDAALTTARWRDRILGRSEMVDLPLRAAWYATGNNCAVGADSARRIIQCRLDVLEERPEERTGFQHPDLIGWVRGERARLLRAVLLMLSAYTRAGRPDQRLPPMGSFEGWSALVRSAVVWAGLPDPLATQRRLMATADTGRYVLGALLAAWQDHLGQRGVRVADLIGELWHPAETHWPMSGSAIALRGALEGLTGCAPCKPPTAHRLGNRLRIARRHVVRGVYLDHDPTADDARGAVWRLYGGEVLP